ncbi:MAG: DUF86 domain-containing protein [Candidatus Kapaibacterium sp.]
MRPTETRLRDILEAIDAIREFVDEVELLEYFESSSLYQSAVIYQLIIMGEATAHIEENFKARYSNIPWDMLKRFRNFAAHQYFGVDWIEVWNMCQRILNEIEDKIIDVMKQEFPDF